MQAIKNGARDKSSPTAYKSSRGGYNQDGKPEQSHYAEVKLNADGTVVVGEITEKEKTDRSGCRCQYKR